MTFLASASGFSLVRDVQEGSMASGEILEIPVTLMAGSDYMLVGFCDQACSNLDLLLLDASGEEVQADTLPDSQPMVTFSPESLHPSVVKVVMARCATPRCRFALGILGRSQEPGVPPGEDMIGRLALFGSELRVQGFTEIEGNRIGSLATDQAVRIPVSARQGLEYRIVGVCDQDCWDLDLALYDSAGGEVASDFLEDALPILAFSPESDGSFEVEVIMVACGLEPCGFRLGTYAKSDSPGPTTPSFSGELLFFETYDGELGPDDEQLGQAYVDEYEVQATAGQRIVVDLRSDEFDTLVRLLGPDGHGTENDDFAGEVGHSHIEQMALVDGTYSVQVTSFEGLDQGAYVLQIAVVK